MNAPIVTDSMREWAEAYVNSCEIAAEAMGQPFDREKAQAAIRAALLDPTAGRLAPDLDPVTDDHSGPVDEVTAGRAAASNYPESMAGDFR